MPEWSRKTWQSLFVPGGILLAGVALLDYVGWLNLTLPALSFLYYCGLAGGMLLAWRFHSSRIFFALCVLFLSGQAISLFGGTQPSLTPSGVAAVDAIAVLLPLNYILIALMQERGFTTGSAQHHHRRSRTLGAVVRSLRPSLQGCATQRRGAFSETPCREPADSRRIFHWRFSDLRALGVGKSALVGPTTNRRHPRRRPGRSSPSDSRP